MKLRLNHMLIALSACFDVLKLVGVPVSVIWIILGNVREHLVLFAIILMFGLMLLIDDVVLWWYGRKVNNDNIDDFAEKIYKRRSSYMLSTASCDHIDKEYVKQRLKKALGE